MTKLKEILLKPIPYSTSKYTSVILGLLVYVILASFHPFGLHSVPTPKRYFVEMGFGFITFAIVATNMFLLPKLFPKFFYEDNYKVYLDVIFTLLTVAIISIGNTLFLHFLDFIDLSIPYISMSILYTTLVGIFPVFFLTLMKYNRYLKQNLKDAAEISSAINAKDQAEDSRTVYKFTGLSDNDTIEVDSNKILFVQSQRNYIQFFYNKNDNCTSKLIRATMKEVEESLTEFPNLQRCHRSYIVNIDKIKSIDGDSLGYNLHLDNCTEPVPVSRSYTKIFKQRFF